LFFTKSIANCALTIAFTNIQIFKIDSHPSLSSQTG
jgi:hypothetical protein